MEFQRPRRAYPNYLELKIGLDPIIIYHQRVVYTFFDVLGDVGGVL
jgi:hypothetical protein